MPTVKVKQTTTQRRLTGKTRLWPSAEPTPCSDTRVWSTCFHLRGLVWQPFDACTSRPLISEKSSHSRMFPFPSKPCSPCAPFLSLGKGVRGTMNERGSLALLLSPTKFQTFIYYLCVLYFKQTSSLLSSSSHSVSVAFQGEAGHLFILI